MKGMAGLEKTGNAVNPCLTLAGAAGRLWGHRIRAIGVHLEGQCWQMSGVRQAGDRIFHTDEV